MDELLGIDCDALAGIAADSSDDELTSDARSHDYKSTPTKPMPTAQKSNLSDEERLTISGGTKEIAVDAFAPDGGDGQLCAASSAVRVATTPCGLGLFATRGFAMGEVIFSERPQVAVANSRKNAIIHCDSCLRTMMRCPTGLPHPEFWPETPRQTTCGSCAMTFCCRTCQSNADAAGHSRFCDAVPSAVPDAAVEGRLATFDGCCRELMAMSPNPGQLTSICHLALRMMANMLKVAEPGSKPAGKGAASATVIDESTAAKAAQQRALQLYAHLTTTIYTAGANRDWCESAALRLYPLAQRTLHMSDEESTWLTADVMRELLRCVSLNSICIEPVSGFADYVRASVSSQTRGVSLDA